MQLFEAIFLLVFTIGIFRLVFGPAIPRLTYPAIGFAALGVLILGAVFEGMRWQMLPAYLGFGLLMLGALKKAPARWVWRSLGAAPLVIMLAGSAFLAVQVPIVSLPAPTGPYAVGTFDYSITDESRVERFSPQDKRELYVEVWYPAEPDGVDSYSVRTLFQELYEGDFTQHSLMFGYLDKVPTHSHVEAPLVAPSGEKYPVLLFSHALAPGFTSQNQLLMEHLASHGYVVLSVAHPYQSSKVNLPNAGTIAASEQYPPDLELPHAKLPEGLVGKVFRMTGDMHKVSAMKRVLLPMAETYAGLTESEREAFLDEVMQMEEVEPFRQYMTRELLQDHFLYDYIAWNSTIQYWVEDMQSVAGSLSALDTKLLGLTDAIETDGFGVMGMSVGGAAATEFCKVDARCLAGVNLDGTAWGNSGNQPVLAPFLMLYNEEHQGGNDFAYLPNSQPYYDYRIEGAGHVDFTDFSYSWPLFKTIGFAGEIDGMRISEISNRIVLEFLDASLAGKSLAPRQFDGMPEVTGQLHPIAAEPAD